MLLFYFEIQPADPLLLLLQLSLAVQGRQEALGISFWLVGAGPVACSLC